MELQCTWNEKLQFTAQSEGHSVNMDTTEPLGANSALSPKHLLMAAICGCAGMDVVSLLGKYKEPFDSFEIEAQASFTDTGHPIIFKEVQLTFKLKGSTDATKFIEAVTLSQTKYCGVSAMVSKAAPISFTIELNGENIGTGKSEFSNQEVPAPREVSINSNSIGEVSPS